MRISTCGTGVFSVLDSASPSKPEQTGDFRLHDISVRGARIEISGLTDGVMETLIQGRKVLAVNLDEAIGRPVRALAFARWAEKDPDDAWMIGIEFTEISDEHRARLQEYLFALLGAAGIPMDDSDRILRAKLRRVSPYMVGAAAILVGLVVGHMASWSAATRIPSVRLAQFQPATSTGSPIAGRRAP